MNHFYLLMLTCFLVVWKSTDSTKLVEKDTKNVHDELDDPSSDVAYDKHLDRPNQTRSKVDFRKYRRIARANEYPYHVAIIIEPNHIILCQGALINTQWMLTAGTCYKKYSQLGNDVLQVVAGTNYVDDPITISRNISDVKYHPDFFYDGYANDLALIKFDKPIPIDNIHTKTIELSTSKRPIGTMCNYSSFEELVLYGYELTLMNSYWCDDNPTSIRQVLRYSCASIGDIHFLTNINQRAEFNHVGTPLVCDNQLQGIKTKNGFFTDTYEITSWVHSVIDKKIKKNKKRRW